MRLVLFVLSLLCGTAAAVLPTPFPISQSYQGDKFMVAATNAYVTAEGYNTLAAGGNAVDAMVAMQVMMTVTESALTGLAGGSFVLFYHKDKNQVLAFDGRDTAPASAYPTMFLDKQGKVLPAEQLTGPSSVAVPGTLKVLHEMHRRYGKLPWKRLIAPAIKRAREGFILDSDTSYILEREHRKRLAKDAGIRKVYWQGQTIHPTGSILYNPELAKSLELIAKQGADALYKGALGNKIVAHLKSVSPPGRPLLSMEDLRNYRVVEREPIRSHYRGYSLVSFPYPSTGGTMVLQALGMLEGFALGNYPLSDPEPWRLVVEASRVARADRLTFGGDPRFVDTPAPRAMLDKDYLKGRAKLIPAKAVAMMTEPKPGQLLRQMPATSRDPESPDTGHISIVDGEGNAIAMTSTLGTGFGSGIMVGGLVLNAQMGNFSKVAQRDGRPDNNRIEPGKRPRSATAPLMMFKPDGGLRLVIGSPGSAQIPGYILKVITGMVDWGLSAQASIDLPNVQFGTKIDRSKPDNPRGLLVEKNGFTEWMAPAFAAMGYKVIVLPYWSGINAIEIRDGKLHGATDHRRASSSLGQ